MISFENLLYVLLTSANKGRAHTKKLWKKFVYICLHHVQDENQDMLIQ